MSYLTQLNEDQLKAVKTTEGYLRVIAGAGSGKTKLLVSRYVYLVTTYGIDPANILCVTFTNKAAREMKQRIKLLLGDDFDSSLICTYHGFCARVLREDSDKIFYPKNFQILDSDAQKAILRDIYQKYELKLDNASFEKTIKRIEKTKQSLDYVEKMCNPSSNLVLGEQDSLEVRIIEEYLQHQKRTFALDFQDLLNFTLYLFEKSQQTKEKWQEKLNYIQVDEFQDSSVKEMALIDILSAKYKNVMIVGDPDQNIYEWRGSNVKLLVDFDKTHEDCQTQFLTRNYRSTSKVLRCANTLIENNKFRLKKDLYTLNGEGEDVVYYHEKNEHEEALTISNIIKALIEAGYSYSDIAILYRSSFLSWPIEKKLNEECIPYEIFGGVKFYQRMEIQDVIAYLRVICYDDDISFKRIINKPRRRFGKVKMQRLLALQQGESLFETLSKNIDDEIFKKSDAIDFVRLIRDMRQRVLIDGVADLVSALCEESGYENYIRELGDMDRFDNLTEFKRIVVEQERTEGEALSMDIFLERIALQTDEDDSSKKESVKLMTVHSSKGLEFPVVFIMGLSENVFPNPKAVEERGELGMEEERRLCYVAITRAKERLFITESEGVSPSGKIKTPSRFLREIGCSNYKSFGIEADSIKADCIQQINTNNDSFNLSVGEKINHPAFGEGVILSLNDSGTSYKIKFNKDGIERNISANFFNGNSLKVIEQEDEEERPQKSKEMQERNIDLDKLKKETKKMPIFLYGERPKQSENNQTMPPQSQNNEIRSMIINENFSNTGWRCVGITDMGAPSVICQFCNKQTLRYVHHMENINGEKLDVGCVCAGKLDGNLEKAQEREKKIKRSQMPIFISPTQKNNKLSKSANGNYFTKIDGHLIVILADRYNENRWRYAIDGVFSDDSYKSIEEALKVAINRL